MNNKSIDAILDEFGYESKDLAYKGLTYIEKIERVKKQLLSTILALEELQEKEIDPKWDNENLKEKNYWVNQRVKEIKAAIERLFR
jgi:hypothetical protein